MRTPKIFLLFGVLFPFGTAQIWWTPISYDESSQIDLWTREASGCQCNFDAGKLGCACCSKGGCACGRPAPKRCTQCGLESHCPKFCNMTLDSRELFSRSGKSFGQIKSPSLRGPAICYYSFIPLPDQRTELQFYRLVNLGVFNGTHCHGGFLQLVDGSNPVSGRTEIKICGDNDRYDPPVLVFADNGPATLIFQWHACKMDYLNCGEKTHKYNSKTSFDSR